MNQLHPKTRKAIQEKAHKDALKFKPCERQIGWSDEAWEVYSKEHAETVKDIANGIFE